MASQGLLQDTVEYNRKVNLAHKVLKSKKCPLSTLPLMSKRPVQSGMPVTVPVESLMSKRPGQSGMPVTVPVESGRVRRRRVSSGKAHIKPKVSMKPRTS